MENLYQEYKPKIDKCFNELKMWIEKYEQILTRNPKDQIAENKQTQLYIYLNNKKKELEDLRNHRSYYDAYVEEMNNYIAGVKKSFEEKYLGKFFSSKSLSDAKKALEKCVEELTVSLKEIKDFNTKYKQKGNHTDNYAAIKVMKEIESKIQYYKDELVKEEKKSAPNYSELINRFESASSYYRRYVKSTIRDQQYYG